MLPYKCTYIRNLVTCVAPLCELNFYEIEKPHLFNALLKKMVLKDETEVAEKEEEKKMKNGRERPRGRELGREQCQQMGKLLQLGQATRPNELGTTSKGNETTSLITMLTEKQ